MSNFGTQGIRLLLVSLIVPVTQRTRRDRDVPIRDLGDRNQPVALPVVKGDLGKCGRPCPCNDRNRSEVELVLLR